MDLNVGELWNTLATKGMDIGLRLLGAIVLWFVGGWLIGIATRLVRRAVEQRKMDVTIANYIVSALQVLLKVVLVVAILGYFGVETTSFAAILAAAGIAVGTAWAGLLAHYAAGIFMVVLRPFKVGDFITAGGSTGTVDHIGLFATSIITPENVRTFVGNNRIFSDTIQNFSANAYRRVDLVAQLSHGDDHRAAIAKLKTQLAAIPHVVATPVPEVDILTFTLAGPVLAVRPFTHTDNYWSVYFATNMAIREAGFAIPEQHVAVKNKA